MEEGTPVLQSYTVDQIIGAQAGLAFIVGTYYKALKEQQVPEELAQALVVAYQTTFLHPLATGLLQKGCS